MLRLNSLLARSMYGSKIEGEYAGASTIFVL